MFNLNGSILVYKCIYSLKFTMKLSLNCIHTCHHCCKVRCGIVSIVKQNVFRISPTLFCILEYYKVNIKLPIIILQDMSYIIFCMLECCLLMIL